MQTALSVPVQKDSLVHVAMVRLLDNASHTESEWRRFLSDCSFSCTNGGHPSVDCKACIGCHTDQLFPGAGEYNNILY